MGRQWEGIPVKILQGTKTQFVWRSVGVVSWNLFWGQPLKYERALGRAKEKSLHGGIRRRERRGWAFAALHFEGIGWLSGLGTRGLG